MKKQKRYEIINNKAVRKNPICPRCKTMLADKGDWWSCGKCGDRYSKETFGMEQ